MKPPRMMSRSTWPTAPALTRTSAWPADGWGAGTSSTTGADPHAWTLTARTSAPGEAGASPFQEGLEALPGVLGLDELEDGPLLDGQRLVEGAAPTLVHAPL